MAMQKDIKRLFTITASSVIGLGLLLSGVAWAEISPSASTDRTVMVLESVRQNYLASKRAEELRGKLINVPLSSPPLIVSRNPGEWLRKVNNSSVNMVTNRLSSGEQKVVRIDGRDFYVPNEDYGYNLRQNPSLRYATDPVTGKKIDKSGALAYADYKDRVFYFESEQSYREFLSLLGK